MARPKKAVVVDTMPMGLLTNQDFVGAFNQIMQEPMPVVAAHTMLILQEELKVHHKNFETLRQKLINQYGETDASGALVMNEEKTQYKLRDIAAFNKEFVELMNLQVPITKIPLKYLENLQISPANLKLLIESIVKA